jgi:DNA-binding beta-propeller fold protein YncE
MSAYVPSNTGVVVLDLISNSVAGTIQISGVPQNVAFTSDGSMAFVSVMNGNAVVIDTAIDQVIQQLPASNTLGVAIM